MKCTSCGNHYFFTISGPLYSTNMNVPKNSFPAFSLCPSGTRPARYPLWLVGNITQISFLMFSTSLYSTSLILTSISFSLVSIANIVFLKTLSILYRRQVGMAKL